MRKTRVVNSTCLPDGFGGSYWTSAHAVVGIVYHYPVEA